jgi:hypothetical protein
MLGIRIGSEGQIICSVLEAVGQLAGLANLLGKVGQISQATEESNCFTVPGNRCPV